MEPSPHQLAILWHKGLVVVDKSDGLSSEPKNWHFVWTSAAIQLLCCGYLRQELIEYPNDFASLLFKYVGLVKGKLNCVSIGPSVHSKQWILFKPNMSKLERCRMTVTLVKSECESPAYINGGYYFQCGLMGVPSTDTKQLQKFDAQFEKLVASHFMNGDIKQLEKSVLDNNKDDMRIQYYCLHFSKFSNLNKVSCGFGRHSIDDVEGFYPLYFNITDNSNDNDNDNGITNVENANENDKAMNEFMLENNDTIDICVEMESNVDINDNDKDNQWFLYFIKNKDQIIGEKNELRKEVNFENGKVKLDFKKYYYYFMLRTVVCGCRNDKLAGFEYEIEYT